MGVNKHLTHVEELVLTKGNDGAQEALSMLEQVGKTLSPSGGAAVTITTKWDGAPAVVCGIDPADGQFFVGTKGVFAKEPKMYIDEGSLPHNERAERLNGRLAMLGVIAAIGSYAVTGQLIPGIY